MSEAEIAATILQGALKLGVVIYEGVRNVLAGHRPDLLPAPPPRADVAIASEDAARIADKFPPAPPTTPTGQPPNN